MTARKYRSKEGDSIDWVCWRAYGRLSAGLVEKVLDANPGLAEHGPLLPAGVLVVLPEGAATSEERRVRLWG